MKKAIFTLDQVLLTVYFLYSQEGISIGDGAPDPSAMLPGASETNKTLNHEKIILSYHLAFFQHRFIILAGRSQQRWHQPA